MRRGGMFAVMVAVLVGAWVATNGRHREVPKPAGPAPDTAVAGSYRAELPAADAPGHVVSLRLTGFLTARMEHEYGNGQPPVVDTGAWTKDDDGAVVVTLAPRDTATDSGDTLRFVPRGDSLVYRGEAYGAAGLTLVRTR